MVGGSAGGGRRFEALCIYQFGATDGEVSRTGDADPNDACGGNPRTNGLPALFEPWPDVAEPSKPARVGSRHDGLQPERRTRRRAHGNSTRGSCKISRASRSGPLQHYGQMIDEAGPGPAAEFLESGRRRPEIKKCGFSMFTPQVGATGCRR